MLHAWNMYSFWRNHILYWTDSPANVVNNFVRLACPGTFDVLDSNEIYSVHGNCLQNSIVIISLVNITVAIARL